MQLVSKECLLVETNDLTCVFEVQWKLTSQANLLLTMNHLPLNQPSLQFW